MLCTMTGYEREEIAVQLDEALQHLRELRKQNAILQELIDNERRKSEKYNRDARSQILMNRKSMEITPHESELIEVSNMQDVFSLEHELSRRLVESRIWEVFYYIHVTNSDSSMQYSVKKHVEEQLLSLLGTMSNLSEVDGAAKWRQDSLRSLTDFIQEKIYRMQHPKDCKKAK
ncbi:hypothetical protein DICVIV_10927 [Dictyocaulus viviparus]|uniref:Alpha-(1,6)-fucosyltransferase N- and catalytic domain-containing protein n=1 Tax=Dictyocaulus viviparus TaxID=29172 RepID=A0A0D8XH56_DICVI|nr:hypothetical protein DICVIV_10927 [Dictyocaulus viviparus]